MRHFSADLESDQRKPQWTNEMKNAKLRWRSRPLVGLYHLPPGSGSGQVRFRSVTKGELVNENTTQSGWMNQLVRGLNYVIFVLSRSILWYCFSLTQASNVTFTVSAQFENSQIRICVCLSLCFGALELKTKQLNSCNFKAEMASVQ